MQHPPLMSQYVWSAIALNKKMLAALCSHMFARQTTICSLIATKGQTMLNAIFHTGCSSLSQGCAQRVESRY